MKWLVFSDSHGKLDYMKRAVLEEKPDRILHLGDVVRDGERLQAQFGEIPLEGVRGNCDGYGGGAPEEREVFFHDRRVWMLHGHTYHVKLGLGLLAGEARTRGVDVVLFGHTHEPMCTREGGLWLMNPGTASGYPRATYGVIEDAGKELACRIEELPR